MHLTLDTAVVASKDHVAADLADEVVLLSLRTGAYYGLNPVAAAIWNLIQEPRTVLEIRTALLAEFSGITEEQCTEEVIALLSEMIAMELVHTPPVEENEGDRDDDQI